ncbi:MAG: exo-alpha-sialidase [Acidimicrobiia bacterium]|nr:exo-alpha-sialidase [Acidimicrobiia bacterium]
MRTPLLMLAALVATAVTPVGSQSASLTLGLPGTGNSAPWLASSGSLVALAWGAGIGQQADVYVAVSRNGARTFSDPVRVNASAGEVRLNGEIAPRVALAARDGREPEIVVLWNARGTPNAIKITRSTDGGRTFQAPEALQGPGAEGDRGWHALALDAAGQPHAVWLDHRGLAAAKRDGASHQAHDGMALAQRSSLYYAAPGLAPARALFAGVCYCCKTAMAVGPKGELFAAWRHVFAGNLRDMAFTSSRDGGRTFSPMARVHEDGWAINGCPDDGPAMAVDAAGAVHLVWPTVPGGTEGALHYAVAADGRRFAAPMRVATLGGPKPSHPQIAMRDGRVFVAWDEVRNGIRSAALREVTGGRQGEIVTLGAPGATSSYPVLAGTASGLVAAWTDGTGAESRIGVRVITR